jgi:porphobilinogen synthase
MVKPTMPYLDIIADAAELTPNHPIACYQVSGEFAMVHAGAAAVVYDLKTMMFVSVEGMVRALAGTVCFVSLFNQFFYFCISILDITIADKKCTTSRRIT